MGVSPGYKQTEVGVIPEDWDVKQLGTLVTYTNGKAHEQNISNSGRYVVANSKFISSEGETRKYSEHCFCPTLKGDVLMVMSDVPNGRAIAKCYWVEKDKTYTVNQRICALTPRGIDGKLLFFKLDRNPFYLAFDDGAKQTNLRKDEVLACPLGIPKSGDEQRAISGALSDVNALISGLNQLIAKKRELKQATMHQLLTGDKRLPGFHGEWETKRLGDVADVFKGVGLSKAALSYQDVGNAFCMANFSQLTGVSLRTLPAEPMPRTEGYLKLVMLLYRVQLRQKGLTWPQPPHFLLTTLRLVATSTLSEERVRRVTTRCSSPTI